mgnify:FL=1
MIPWTERPSRWRGPLDLLAGAYPSFLLGRRPPRGVVPVFHFHEATPEGLAPYLDALVAKGYHTLGRSEFLAVLEGGETPEGAVLLTFDDAYTSAWTVVAPLLAERGLRAITFAIPGRVSREGGCRPRWGDAGWEGRGEDRGEEPFARWDELRALEAEGVVAVESHSYAHARVPVGPAVEGESWTAAELEALPLLSRPVVREEDRLRPGDAREEGRPRHPLHSRFSRVPAWIPAPDGSAGAGRRETAEEQRAAIAGDIRACRDSLRRELGREPALFCFPWTVAGPVAVEEVRAAGYRAAFADFFPGRRYYHPRADRYRLMRLKHEWIPRLPAL